MNIRNQVPDYKFTKHNLIFTAHQAKGLECMQHDIARIASGKKSRFCLSQPRLRQRDILTSTCIATLHADRFCKILIVS